MTDITPETPRTSIIEGPDELRLVIRRRWGAAGRIQMVLISVAFFGLALWALVFEVQLIHGGGANPGDTCFGFPLFFLGCIGGGCFHLYFLFRRMAGREEVVVKNGQLTLRREVFGSISSRTFDLSQVCNPCVCRALIDWNPFRRPSVPREGRMAFDYARERVRFGGDLGQEEARPLVAALSSRLPGAGRLCVP